MAVLYANNAITTLAAAITSATATTLTVATGTGALFPSPTGSDFFFLTLTSGSSMEIVKVTGVSGDTFTIVRGQDGTTATTFPSGASAANFITKAVLDQIKIDAVAAAIATNTINAYSATILHQSDIGTLLEAYSANLLTSSAIGTTIDPAGTALALGIALG